MDSRSLLAALRAKRNSRNIAGMARFGINSKNTLGVPIPVLRQMARQAGRHHGLALELWESGVHEARILAVFVDEPPAVTETQMEEWAAVFDSWDVCDQVCSNLFDRTSFARQKALEWSLRGEEFVKRAGFVLMAAIAVHDKNASDESFEPFLSAVKRESGDGRNFVKKAVNWALRQIGKRNAFLRKRALAVAREIQGMDSTSGRWIASDAIRELERLPPPGGKGR